MVDTVEQHIPVLTVPAPPTIYRPDLAIYELTNMDHGDYSYIVKTYKVSIIQLLNYVQQLELIVDSYDKLATETR